MKETTINAITAAISTATALGVEAKTPKREVEYVSLRSVTLWQNAAPRAKGTAEIDRPKLAIFPAPKERATGCAMVVCPGGGYWVRAMDHEGLQVAQWLNTQGIDAFLLSYRTRTEGYDPEIALGDATRAMRYVRAHAAEYAVDPKRIGMIGFSAGAHLVSWVAEKADAGMVSFADEIERQSSRPDFLIVVYGTPSAQADEINAPVKLVRADTPPTFIALTHTDFVEPQGAYRQMIALRQAGIEAELHVFGGDGAHGRGLHTGDPDTGVWPSLAMHWLKRNNFLTGLSRTTVEGNLTIDGMPPFMAWITMQPVDNPNAPSASIHISDGDRAHPANGHFLIPEKFGPVPGRYRVEIRHQAKDFLNIPSIGGERVYTKLSPSDSDGIEVAVRPGTNQFDWSIRSQ